MSNKDKVEKLSQLIEDYGLCHPDDNSQWWPVLPDAEPDNSKVVFVVLGVILAVLVAFLVGVLLSDFAWCHDNYQVDRIPHCMWYENNIFGRFIQPAGVGG